MTHIGVDIVILFRVSVLTAKLLGGMSGMHDSLIKQKADGFKEANSAASRPAERHIKRMEASFQRTTRGVKME